MTGRTCQLRSLGFAFWKKLLDPVGVQQLIRRHPFVPVLIGLGIVLCCFANKAIHIDDPLFVWTARQIRSSPLDFYGYVVNWTGRPLPVHATSYNPPLFSYYLAAAMTFLGSSEVALHCAAALLALLLAAGIYLLSKTACQRPVLALLISIANPIFLVSSTTLMCDVGMLACWVWAMVVWRKGIQASGWLLPLSGFIAGLGILTKYNGILVLPLLAIMTWPKKQSWRWAAAGLSVPLLMLVGYEFYTSRLYGHSLFGGSAEAAKARHAALVGNVAFQTLSCLAFLGGGAASAALSMLRFWSWRVLSVGGGIMAAIALGICMIYEGPGVAGGTARAPSVWVSIQLIGWAAAGFCFLAAALGFWWRRRDAINTLLILWLGGGILYSVFVNFTLSGRSLLPLLPAAAILVVRWLDSLPQTTGRWRVWLPVGASGALGLLAAFADFRAANSVREMSARICREVHPEAGRPLWFQGHWGFQYYMERNGALPLDLAAPAMEPGDWLATPYNNVLILMFPPQVLSESRTLAHNPYPQIAVMDVDAGAGFYSSHSGPLPFALGPIAPDVYYVQRINQKLHPVMSDGP